MTWEEWHAFITAHLGTSVVEEQAADGATWFTAGDPGEVLVRLKGSSITVFEFTVERQDRTSAIVPRRVGALRARGLADARAMAIVAGMIDATRELRLARFRTCDYCERRLPPEWMAEAGICQACVDQSRGAVH